MSGTDSLKELTLENYYTRLCAIVAKAYGAEILLEHGLAPSITAPNYYADEQNIFQRAGKLSHF